jgi:hypothetical protein
MNRFFVILIGLTLISVVLFDFSLQRSTAQPPAKPPLRASSQDPSRRATPQQSPQNQAAPVDAAASFGKLALSFEVNRGQSDPSVKFLAHGNGSSFFLTSNEAVMVLSKPVADRSEVSLRPKDKREKRLTRPLDRKSQVTAVVRMTYVNGNRETVVSGSDEAPNRSNYYKGNDPTKWLSDVPNYSKVKI